MKKFYFIGLGLVVFFIIIGLFSLLDDSSRNEAKVISNGKQSDDGNLVKIAEELAGFIETV